MNILECLQPWKRLKAKVRTFGTAMDIRIPINSKTNLLALWEEVSSSLTIQFKDVVVTSSTLCPGTLSVLVRHRPHENRPPPTQLMVALGLTRIYPVPGEETDSGDADRVWSWIETRQEEEHKLSADTTTAWGLKSTQLLTGFIFQRIVNKLFEGSRSLRYNWADGGIFEVIVNVPRPPGSAVVGSATDD